jgi:hypothetical protein
MTIRIQAETHEDIQQPGCNFECYIIILDDKRIFSTEDVRYLETSARLFTEDQVTLLLEADRNSAELPELGPKMDIAAGSPLRITRRGSMLEFASEINGELDIIGITSLKEWNKEVCRALE